MFEALKKDAQESLDDLWMENGLPFKIIAYEVEGGQKCRHYTLRFLDSRLPSQPVYWNAEERSFKKVVREVVQRTFGQRRGA